MLFSSIEFAVFLPLVFTLYWFVLCKNLKTQNFFLLVASYIFYGWWDWRFLGLICISSLTDFILGLRIQQSHIKPTRKLYLIISILVNLGFLGVFKYYNFFIENLTVALESIGWQANTTSLKIILPVGISFYTFQTLSYTIDVYRNKIQPTTDIISFFAYVSFFPQLVAGPIERAANLLPQFHQKRQFSYKASVDGMQQILWGLFKKMVIADNCALLVDKVFSTPGEYHSITLMLGAVFFAFQIYGDFSGYSDIAIGTARLFGFNLMQNFAFPYFSRDIAEFWRRWHISLSSWFRDYVYIPLGGSRVTKPKIIRNVFVIFLVSGFWHGANWTFIIWGAIHAALFLPLLLFNRNRKNVAFGHGRFQLLRFLSRIATFILVCLAWIFFRAENLTHALDYFQALFTNTQNIPHWSDLLTKKMDWLYIIFISILLIFEWKHRSKQHGLDIRYIRPIGLRISIYLLIALLIFYFSGDAKSFIYFQF